MNGFVQPRQDKSGDIWFRKLIEHSTAGVTLLDGDLNFVYRNPSADRTMGWLGVERTEITFSNLIHPQDRELLHQFLINVKAEPGKPVKERLRTLHYAGFYLTIEYIATNLLDVPEVKAILLNFVDVSRQIELEIEAQTRISQNAAQLKQLLDGITDGFMTADSNQCYTYVNKRLGEIVGLDPREMIGQRIWDVFPDAVGTKTYQSIQKAIGEKQYVCSEDYYAPLDLWQENRIYPGPEGFSMFIKDITSRKKADEQLHLLFDRTPDMIGILGLDRYYKRVNPAMCNILEYTYEQLLSTPLDSLVHPDDLETSRQRTKAFMEGGDQTLYFENRYVTKSKRTIWLSWTVTRSAGEGLLFCVGKNISEKKALENLLEKTSTLARIGSWEINVTNKTMYWSKITRAIYEADQDFIPDFQSAISSFKEGADRQTVIQRFNDCIKSGVMIDEELRIITVKGNEKWVRMIGEAEFLHGACQRIYGSFQDIDQQKKNSLELEKSEEKYSKLFHLSPQPMWVYEISTLRFLDVNEAAIRHYGFSREEFLRMSITDIRPKQEIPILEESIKASRDRTYSFYNHTFKHRKKNGEIIIVNIESTPISYLERSAKVILATDVTERFQYIAAMENHNKKLKEISWIQSHVIRAPVARLMAYIDLIKNYENTEDEKDEILKGILKSAHELDVIIKDVSQMAKTVVQNN